MEQPGVLPFNSDAGRARGLGGPGQILSRFERGIIISGLGTPVCRGGDCEQAALVCFGGIVLVSASWCWCWREAFLEVVT
jgi:hypothetical protein